MTHDTLELFIALAKDAGNWSGTPLFGGNVANTLAAKGHLIHLKQNGLVWTETDSDNKGLCWVHFTGTGVALAAKHGIEV